MAGQGCGLTAPVLVLSSVQSGMIWDKLTIQLLILSLRRRSTTTQAHADLTFYLGVGISWHLTIRFRL